MTEYVKVKYLANQTTEIGKKHVLEKKFLDKEMFIPIENIMDKRDLKNVNIFNYLWFFYSFLNFQKQQNNSFL